MICACSHPETVHVPTPHGAGACTNPDCGCWRFDLDMDAEAAR
jgi:hypothetical protein